MRPVIARPISFAALTAPGAPGAIIGDSITKRAY
jgi:hypothetical protein